MTDNRYTTSKTCVFNIGYHLIWCPKFRRAVLENGVDIRLKELIYKKAKENNYEIVEMDILPDHVHIFLKCDPTESPHRIVQQLKGYTSRIIRQEYPKLKTRLPSLWTRSYYCESVGHISKDTVIKYIQDQKNR